MSQYNDSIFEKTVTHILGGGLKLEGNGIPSLDKSPFNYDVIHNY